MLDINLIRENSDLVKLGISAKGHSTDVIDQLLEIDQKRRELINKVDLLRQQRNDSASKKDIEAGKKIKAELQQIEPDLGELEKKFKSLILQIPNIPSKDSPVGKDESENKLLKEVGEKKNFSFTPKDHLELGESLGIIDFETAAKVSGSNFYYLKNEGAMLEIALVHYALDFLIKKNFSPVITPDLAREKYYLGTGYLPQGPEAQIYQIADSDLGLIATSEITLAGMYADSTLDELPKKYAGYSHCFRLEAGAYGKYSKGLYRVHQFTKVEMFGFVKPEDSESIHLEFLNNEEEFFQSLGIPFRVLEMCTGDLGSQAARKFDLEAWMPGRGEWGEVTSTSNTTDFQSRNLNIKFKQGDKSEFVHTLNGTLMASSRAIIAILENFQAEDGSVKIPEVLQKYTGFSEIKPKNN